ncbi:tRNA selenocysteine 1-associated protein 1-like [Saccoglossus kowalevskii]|uniref:tRNA selenocysteine-associated protein 1 n=1 Tax=Saccoglossus kowalevskii TaxID=10224 RepID=A0ABM0GPA8_SACKO|nr:PREDICTED: tRNA selenocysteine 1-associated protein 1-like [Saccoglossus kowalevskii]
MTSSVWMGDLEPYMDEAFVIEAFASVGEKVLNVKIIRNKYTRIPQGYCFVDFGSDEIAKAILRKYNGKPLPGSNNSKRFKLNFAAYGQSYQSPEFSLFVGELTPEVDNCALHEFFAKRYYTCKAANVVLDPMGHSRGYGFVRFSNEEDQQRALIEMNQVTGLGGKSIKVALATPKRPITAVQSSTQHQPSSQNYGDYYQQYQQQYHNYYAAWNSYPSSQQQTAADTSVTSYSQCETSNHGNTSMKSSISEDDVFEDIDISVDVDKANAEFISKHEELFEAVENSRWQPLDNVMSEIPGLAIMS